MIKNQQLLYKDSVEKICDTLEGHVYETSIPFEQLEAFRKQYILLSEKQERGNMIVRFIHKGKAAVEWLPVSPQLEDVFLYEYRDEIDGEV